MAFVDMVAGDRVTMDGTRIGPVLPAKDPIGWEWAMNGLGGDVASIAVKFEPIMSRLDANISDPLFAVSYLRDASGGRLHGGVNERGVYNSYETLVVNDGFANTSLSPTQLATTGTADNNSTTWDTSSSNWNFLGTGIIDPDYRVAVFRTGSDVFAHWYAESLPDSGVLHLRSVVNERSGVVVFGTSATNVWFVLATPWTAYALHLYKADLTADTVVYQGSVSISITVVQPHLRAARVPDTDIWHVYVPGSTTTMILKVDTNSGVFAEHASSPMPVLKQAMIDAARPPINHYFSPDGGTTKYIIASDNSVGGLTEKIWYTTNPDSLSYSTENTNFLEEFTAGNFDHYLSGINSDRVFTVERKASATHLVVYGAISISTTTWKYWFNFADAFRPTLDWSGWIEIDDPYDNGYHTNANGRVPYPERITSSYGDYDSGDTAIESKTGLSGDITPYANVRYFITASIYHWNTGDPNIYMEAGAYVQLQPSTGVRMDEIVSMAAGAYLQLIASANLLVGQSRTLDQDWGRGQFREESHEEYIVGTDYYTHNLGLVNTARAAQVPSIAPIRSLFEIDAPSISDDFAYLTMRQIIKHDTVYWHHDPSFDVGFQTYQQKLDAMTPDGIYGYSENLDYHPTYQDPDTYIAPTIQEISQLHFDAWWASTTGHKENMLFDWEAIGRTEMYYLGSIDWSWPMGITGGFAANLAVQQFLDFSVHLGGNEMERTWTNEYQITGAEIIAFYSQYSIAAWQDVRSQVGIKYSLHVSTNFSFPYKTRVAVQIRFPIHYSVLAATSFPYTQLEPVVLPHSFVYDLRPAYAVSPLTYVYSSIIGTQFSFTYGDATPVTAQAAFPYSLRARPISQTSFPYVSVVSVVSAINFNYSLDLNNYVVSDMSYRYALLDETVVTSIEDVTVTVDGLTIPVSSVSVKIREGSFPWSATVVLQNLAVYNSFVQDAPFVVNIGTDSYEMVVEEKSINRSGPAKETITVTGMSPAIKHKVPRAASISFEMTSAIMAKDVVETILGESVTWNVLNWSIPAYRVTAEDISPIKLVSQIVETIGAIPEALKDGTLQIRYKWEIDTNQYPAATPAQIYTDVADNLSASEQTQPFALWNKFRIREGSGVFSDKIEYYENDDIDGDSLRGILRVYPDPWRLTVRVIQTNGPSISLSSRGVIQREEVQLVEFVEGVGTVSYPIVSIDTTDWKSVPLGALVHESHGSEITAPSTVHSGYGLAEITYTTEAIEYDTSAPPSTDAQFLVQDEG